VGLAAGRAGAGRVKLVAAMTLLAVLSVLPDIDVIGFRFGVAYGAPFGHRGATHSLLVGVLVGVVVGAFVRIGGLSRLRTIVLCAAVVCSHGLLDTLTDGGLGVALAWPFSTRRYFAPVRPIPVAPIGRRLLTAWGERVMLTELVMFSPFLLYALWPRARRPPSAGRA
jgi:inner membrane protein